MGGKAGLRFSVAEAQRRGWISKDEAAAMKKANTRGKADQLTPQRQLFDAIEARWPGRAVWEMESVIPGRNFRVDIAFPDERLLIEFDGYQHHGISKKGFKNDRDRQNIFTIAGWRPLRYYVERVSSDLEGVLEEIEAALKSCDRLLQEDEIKDVAVDWRKRLAARLMPGDTTSIKTRKGEK